MGEIANQDITMIDADAALNTVTHLRLDPTAEPLGQMNLTGSSRVRPSFTKTQGVSIVNHPVLGRAYKTSTAVGSIGYGFQAAFLNATNSEQIQLTSGRRTFVKVQFLMPSGTNFNHTGSLKWLRQRVRVSNQSTTRAYEMNLEGSGSGPVSQKLLDENWHHPSTGDLDKWDHVTQGTVFPLDTINNLLWVVDWNADKLLANDRVWLDTGSGYVKTLDRAAGIGQNQAKTGPPVRQRNIAVDGAIDVMKAIMIGDFWNGGAPAVNDLYVSHILLGTDNGSIPLDGSGNPIDFSLSNTQLSATSGF